MIPPLRSCFLLVCLLLVGCGQQVQATLRSTPVAVKKHPVAVAAVPSPTPDLAQSATSAPVPTATQATELSAAATATPQPQPTATSTPPPQRAATPPTQPRPVAPLPVQPATLIAASLTPVTVQAGGTVTATVETRGPVGQVEMYLGSIGPNAPAPLTFTLAETATGTWTGTGTAPSQPGPYHYTVGLYSAGKRTVQDRDAWNIQVAGSQPGPAVAQALPPDIPLAPPFSYGNPVPAVFSASGRTVRGSEVMSNARPDTSAAFVADFYNTRLPRAGWTVDGSSAPGPGATSFSIAATTSGGTRVCVIDFSAATVHIFYGTLTS